MLRRRDWMAKLALGGLGMWAAGAMRAAPSATVRPDALTLTEEQWRARLTPEQFRVLRREGTEPPWTSALNREKRRGTYRCAGCGLALFTNAMKFDSGTGWPSFFETLPGVFGFTTDYRMILPRTEYHCARCGGHHGHVFDDGPRPTGKRYCNNGVCLTFEAEAA
jgi:peptide-methionine (R)-S-oxide reductase